MNGTAGAPTSRAVKTRRLVVRLVLVALYLALATFVFLNGREHTILLDNKTAADGSVQAFRRVKVTVDNGKPLELYARERDLIKVKGQSHRIFIETQESAARTEAVFKVGLETDMLLLSVPKMAAGLEPFWEPFVSEADRPKPGDEAPAGQEGAASVEAAP